MLKKWAEKSTAILYGNHIIEEKIIPLYVYGFQLLYSILLIGTSTFLLSVLFQRKAEWFIFIFCFFCLRLCVGGYHAPTFHSCFIISNIIFLMILGMTELSVKIFQLKSMEILFYVVAMVYIDYRMPQRARWEGICNKKISKKRIQERWLFGVQLCGILYMYINPNVNSRYMNCAIIATFAVAVMIIPIKEEKQDEASTKVSIKGS